MKSVAKLTGMASALVSTALLAIALAPVSTLAQAPAAAPATLKVATLTFNTVVLSTAEAKREFDALKVKYTPRQAQLQSLNTEIQTLQKELQSGGATLSEADRATRGRTLEEKQRQLQRQAEDLKTDSTTDSQQIYARIAQKVYTFLGTYAPQHGYTMVIERGSDSNPIVWYANKSLDITGEVIKAYDAQAATATAPK